MAQSPPTPPLAVAAQQQSPPPTDPHPWRSRPFALDAVLGIATPWGLAGASAEYAPIEQLSLAAGAGTNLSGWQIAAMARARFTAPQRTSFYVGAGYSQGRHFQSDANHDGVFSVLTGPLTAIGHDTRRSREWKTARWFNLELGFDRREQRGFDMRLFAGSAFLLNPDAGVADEPSGSEDRSPAIPLRGFMIYAGTALGFAL